MQAIARKEIPAQMEILSRASRINEYLLTTLRTSWGCDLDFLLHELDFDLLTIHKKELNNFFFLGFMEKTGSKLFLSKKGRLLADKITADLFVEGS